MEDWEYSANYVSDRLYVNPAANNGAYASIAREGEIVVDEFDVGARFKIAISAFYSNSKNDFTTLKIHKLQFRKVGGWFLVESFSINAFQLADMKRLLSVLTSLNMSDANKTRIDLGDISITGLVDLLTTTKAPELLKELSNSPELHADIFALNEKRIALEQFREMLNNETNETAWQKFFEANTWIFGFGLNYVFLDAAGSKFEQVTSGADFNNFGKRADGLAMVRAYVRQFVLIEIKASKTALLQPSQYRSGVWGVSSEVSNAVSQAQKTSHEFSRRYLRAQLKDSEGNDLPEIAYAVEPRSYLIVGNSAELSSNDDKIVSFELYRKNVQSPEILTFDELFFRTENLLAGLTR
ncbi:DUF4263 domain-containing protein [Sulfitobacter sp. F26204]|uniref:Shedu immune nuclease family protein n=1 Tax=Sulfitobacter sp. F26204 TaxID=2996014 RepID=UPI00225DE12A|nr:Shedu immune nuclease family protein [Sulfitobacter sp. F26204]MCX7561077.1 DUF4263 domain-containing protein [Sulfitobacter sp. F26204]